MDVAIKIAKKSGRGKKSRKHNRARNSEKNKRYKMQMRREKNKERRLKRHVALYPKDVTAKKCLDNLWTDYFARA